MPNIVTNFISLIEFYEIFVIITNFISLIEFYEIFVIIRTVGLLQNCNS